MRFFVRWLNRLWSWELCSMRLTCIMACVERRPTAIAILLRTWLRGWEFDFTPIRWTSRLKLWRKVKALKRQHGGCAMRGFAR